MLTQRHKALRFFFDRAGYSYDPATESPFQGRWRAARVLTDAERRLREGEYWVDVVPDDLPWDGDFPYDGPLWIVSLYRGPWWEQELLGSLSGVACPQGDPYLRVVAAELAAEHIPTEGEQA